MATLSRAEPSRATSEQPQKRIPWDPPAAPLVPWLRLLSLPRWVAQLGSLGTSDPESCARRCVAVPPSPRVTQPQHRTGTGPAPPPPPTWMGPAPGGSPRHGSAATPLLAELVPGVSPARPPVLPVRQRVLERFCAAAAPAESAPGEDEAAKATGHSPMPGCVTRRDCDRDVPGAGPARGAGWAAPKHGLRCSHVKTETPLDVPCPLRAEGPDTRPGPQGEGEIPSLLPAGKPTLFPTRPAAINPKTQRNNPGSTEGPEQGHQAHSHGELLA